MRKLARSTVFYIVLAVLALVLVSALFRGGSDREKLSQTTFERKLAAGQVRNAEVSDRDHSVQGVLNDSAGTKYKVTFADRDTSNVLNELRHAPNHLDFKVTQRKDALWLTLLQQFLPFLLLERRKNRLRNTINASFADFLYRRHRLSREAKCSEGTRCGHRLLDEANY